MIGGVPPVAAPCTLRGRQDHRLLFSALLATLFLFMCRPDSPSCGAFVFLYGYHDVNHLDLTLSASEDPCPVV